MIVKSLAVILLTTLPALPGALAERISLLADETPPGETHALPLPGSAAGQASVTLLQRCFQEIDQATDSYENGRADRAREHLQLLTRSCSSVPHLYHNLGAISLLEQNWNEAVDYFEKSLALDTRAAMTQELLAGVYRYKAELAYKKALNLDGPGPSPPVVKMQRSSLRNSRDLNSLAGSAATALVLDDTSAQHSVSSRVQSLGSGDDSMLLDEVRFDVSSWWRAQRSFDADTYFAYYAPEVVPAQFESADQWHADWAQRRKNQQQPLPQWSQVSFQAEHFDSLILVNLRYSSAAADEKPLSKLLVLKKTDQMWQIFKEKTW